MKSKRKPIQWTKQTILLLSCLTLVFFLLGMGGGNNNSGTESGLPIPQQNYSATMTDVKGVETQVHRITWEGKLFFKGQYGSSTITVPFAKITEVEFLTATETTPNAVIVKLQLINNKSVNLSIERSTKIFADTDFGQVEVFVKDLKKLSFKS